MSDFTVARIDPAVAAAERARWDQPRQRDGRPRLRSRASRLSPLVASALQGADPEDCEMVYEYDEAGQVVGLTVRHRKTHATVARFDLAQLTRLVATTGLTGVLFERRG